MKILNPNANARAKKLTATDRAGLKALIASWDGKEKTITFTQLRASLSAAKRSVTDGELHRFLLDEGFEVISDD